MMKYKLFVAALGVFSIILVGISFYLVGSPITQQALNFDRQRLQDFMDIKFQAEDYHRINKKLPVNLGELQTRNILDPETKKTYEYKIVSEKSFQLCTVFSADSKDMKEDITYMYPPSSTSYQHKKGYDCITYTIFDYEQQEKSPRDFIPMEPTPTTSSPEAELSPSVSPAVTPLTETSTSTDSAAPVIGR